LETWCHESHDSEDKLDWDQMQRYHLKKEKSMQAEKTQRPDEVWTPRGRIDRQ